MEKCINITINVKFFYIGNLQTNISQIVQFRATLTCISPSGQTCCEEVFDWLLVFQARRKTTTPEDLLYANSAPPETSTSPLIPVIETPEEMKGGDRDAMPPPRAPSVGRQTSQNSTNSRYDLSP